MVDKVYVELTFQQQKALASIVSVEKRINTFADRAEKNFNKSSQSFNVFVGALAARATAKAFQVLIAGFSSAVTEALEFDKALREIATILPKDAKLTEDLKRSLVSLSTQFATSQANQAKSYYQIISAGITDTAQAMNVLRAANNLSLGGISDLETTITAITKVLSIYGTEAGDATQISDDLFAAVQLGQTKVEALSASFPSILGQAKSLGVTFKETAAALTTLTTRTGSTAEATVGLKGIFSGFIANQTRVDKVLGKNAITTLGLSGALEKLVKVTGSTANLQKVLGSNVRLTNAILAFAADNFETLNTNIEKFETTTGSAKKAADEMSKALDFQWKKFIQGSKNASASLFNDLKPALSKTIIALNEYLGFVSENELAIRKLENSNKKLTNTLAAYSEAQANNNKELKTFRDGLIADIKLNKDKIASLKALKKATDDANNAEGGDGDAGGADGSARVAQEKKIQEAVKGVKAQADLAEEEARIAKQVKNEENVNEEFEKLKETLTLEQAIKLEAKTNLAAEIADADASEIAQAKVQEEKRLAIAKSTTKGIIKEEKLKHASTQNILASTLSAMDAFSQLSEAAFGKNFALIKNIALARIPIFIAEGIARAQTLPFPTNWIQGAATAALGAAQLIQVKKQHFAEGGIFDSTSKVGDKNIGAFNGDEAMLTKKMQGNLINLLNTPSAAQGGGNTFVFNDLVIDDEARIDDIADKLSNAVESRNVRLLSSQVA